MKPPKSALALALALAASAPGCQRDDVKIVQVPPQDIPKENYNKPMPKDVSKYMSGSAPRSKAAPGLSGTK